MRKFVAIISYEVSPSATPDARKLLRAEMVGRRWQDRYKKRPLPSNLLWIERSAKDEQTTRHLFSACAHDLRKAVEAVCASGRPIAVRRVWVQVAGGGTFGLVPQGIFEGGELDGSPLDGSRPAPPGGGDEAES